MPRIRCAAVVVALLLASPAAGEKWPSQRIERLAEWLSAVRAHEPGVADAAVYALASWSNSSIRALWIDVQTLIMFSRCSMCNPPVVKGVDGRAQAVRYNASEVSALRGLATTMRERKETNEILKRAAILHADVVIIVHPKSEVRVEPIPLSQRNIPRQQLPPTPDRVTVQSSDGRQESISNDAIHWDISYVLLDKVSLTLPIDPAKPLAEIERFKLSPETDSTVLQWYRATTAYMQAGALRDTYHFSRALRLFPEDADLNFLNGCLHEAMADARVQTVLRDVKLPAGMELGIKSEHDELVLAERSFRKTLELDAERHEARIHLGRVLGLLGRHEPAAAELRRVPGDLEELMLRYFAALFLGQEEEALGRRDEARTAYTRAGDTFPLAQSPQLALSHLAREAGDREGALAAVKRVLDLPAAEVDRRDPSWYYHYSSGRFVDDWREELYAPFRRAPKP